MDAIQIAAEWTGSRLEMDREEFRRLCSGLPIGPVVVKAEKLRPKRSTPANRRHFALMRVAARELGWDDEYALHDELAHKFLSLPPDEKTGMRRRIRTHTMNAGDFSRFTDTCERYFVADLHLDLSDWVVEMERIA